MAGSSGHIGLALPDLGQVLSCPRELRGLPAIAIGKRAANQQYGGRRRAAAAEQNQLQALLQVTNVSMYILIYTHNRPFPIGNGLVPPEIRRPRVSWS